MTREYLNSLSKEELIELLEGKETKSRKATQSELEYQQRESMENESIMERYAREY